MVGVTLRRKSNEMVSGLLPKRTACQVLSRLACENDRSLPRVHTSPLHLAFKPPAVSVLTSL